MSGQKYVTICLSEDLLRAIDTAAESEQLTRNECVERAMSWYLLSIRRRERFCVMRRGYQEMGMLNLNLAEECLPAECECDCLTTAHDSEAALRYFK